MTQICQISGRHCATCPEMPTPRSGSRRRRKDRPEWVSGQGLSSRSWPNRLLHQMPKAAQRRGWLKPPCRGPARRCRPELATSHRSRVRMAIPRARPPDASRGLRWARPCSLGRRKRRQPRPPPERASWPRSCGPRRRHPGRRMPPNPSVNLALPCGRRARTRTAPANRNRFRRFPRLLSSIPHPTSPWR
jgi:hypothetical protein